MVVTHLTSAGNSPLHVGRMPRTNTSNLPQTFVSLTRQLLCAPSSSDAVETVTLGDRDTVDHLVLLEDGANLDRLLKETVRESDLVGDASSVDLDFHQVCLLLLKGSLANLSVGEDANDGAVLLDSLEFTSDRLAVVLRVLLGVLGESLLLALIPVLVESALNLVAQVLSPNSCERSETTRSLDVTN